jgi:type III secretion system low calcium response chaperone LcrH/SycD
MKKEFENRLVYTPDEIAQSYSFGYSLYENGEYERASKIFEILISHGGAMEKKFWFSYASSLQMLKEYTKALKAWAMTALLDDKNPLPHFHAAECYISLNDFAEAKKALEEAKKRCSTHLDVTHQDVLNQIELLESRCL